MARTPRAARKPRAARNPKAGSQPEAARQLEVTMYNVGFGDCFLVEIPFEGKPPFRMLFDCGQHAGDVKPTVDKVIAAARDADGTPRIDVVVGTHRHKDHVNGFAKDGWDKVKVREVWLPWTEDPIDPKARGIVERQVQAAASALAAFGPGAAEDPDQKTYFGLMELALSNEAAMDTLYNGFSGNPVRRYLPDKTAPKEPLTLAGFPGIRFHVMGPSRDESTLTVMDPPKAETFRKLAAAAAGGDGTKMKPFPDSWALGVNPFPTLLDAKGEGEIDALASRSALTALSAAVDKAINNTSLVIMVEVGKANLLFCADAQWGNWQTILADTHWRDMIGTTTFLKVGHHASHNASPVTLVNELLPEGIPAMISVDPNAYSSVPYGDLLTAFGTRKFKIARSDEPADAAPGYQAAKDVISLKVDF